MADSEEMISEIEMDSPIYIEESNSSYNENDHLFDKYCLDHGAKDVFELFKIKSDDVFLADILFKNMPSILFDYINKYLSINEDKELFNFINSVKNNIEIYDGTTFSLIKNYFKNYNISDIEQIETYVPFFCAHPANIENSKFKVTVTDKYYKSMAFKIGIPGLGGGFGKESNIDDSIKLDESNISLQIQAKVIALIHTWISKNDIKRTFCPISITGIKIADESNPDEYIEYDRTKKANIIKNPLVHRSIIPAWNEIKILNGTKDIFDINFILKGVNNILSIESTVSREFVIEHNLITNHEYTWKGIGSSCHDLFVFAKSV